MNIVSIEFKNVALTRVEVTYNNGNKTYPDRNHPLVQAWVDEGNTILPFVAPPTDPKEQARIDAIPILRATRSRPDVTPITQADFNKLLDYLGIS